MLPPRLWPTNLWVIAAAFALPALHAVGLAVQLALVQGNGGMPTHPVDGPLSPFVQSYSAQVLAGFIPAVILIVLGAAFAIAAARGSDPEVARWGRVFIVAFALLTGALVALGYPAQQFGFAFV
jgi:hypothetical protein